MLKRASAAALAVFAIGLAPLASAQATSIPAAKALPNPCHTFTVKSARALLGVSSRTRLTEKLGSSKNPAARTCTIQHRKTRLVVSISRQKGGTGSGEKCYSYPKLGRGSLLCVSNAGSPPAFSFALFHKHRLWVADGINVREPHKGKRLYQFALAQYMSFKG
jgi:hypothetical protein